jgi:hypothetical protein
VCVVGMAAAVVEVVRFHVHSNTHSVLGGASAWFGWVGCCSSGSGTQRNVYSSATHFALDLVQVGAGSPGVLWQQCLYIMHGASTDAGASCCISSVWLCLCAGTDTRL